MESRPVPTCRQILTDGHFCKCPAMRTGMYCYYHQRQLNRRRILEKAREIKRGYDRHRDSRPEEEFNAEVADSLVLPALDDKAAIHVACSNLMWAVQCDYISVPKARIIMRCITEANLSLRRGKVLDEYKQPVLDADPEPIPPFGDADGCILPEERGRKEAIVLGRAEEAARQDAAIAAARARGEAPPPRPLTPEELRDLPFRQRAARDRAAQLEYYDEVLADPTTDDATRQRLTADRQALLEKMQSQDCFTATARETENRFPGTARVYPCVSDDMDNGASAPGGRAGLQAGVTTHETGASALASAPAGTPVPQPGLKGHGFSHAVQDRRVAPTALPKAGVQRETRNAGSWDDKVGDEFEQRETGFKKRVSRNGNHQNKSPAVRGAS